MCVCVCYLVKIGSISITTHTIVDSSRVPLESFHLSWYFSIKDKSNCLRQTNLGRGKNRCQETTKRPLNVFNTSVQTDTPSSQPFFLLFFGFFFLFFSSPVVFCCCCWKQPGGERFKKTKQHPPHFAWLNIREWNVCVPGGLR